MPSAFTEFLFSFHFLRPYLLLAFIPVALLLIWLRFEKHSAGNWQKVISPQLLPYLISERQGSKQGNPLILLSLLWLISVIAIAGPAWKKLPQPVFERIDAKVIVLDLSLSMYANDVKPSRIQRARLKIIDLLKANKEGLSALVVYAGDPHVVTPLSNDVNTIISLVPSLEPSIMPSYGSNPLPAIELAIDLLQNASANSGSIVLISDGIENSQNQAIANLITSSPYELSILGVGTSDGGPISLANGQFLRDSSNQIVIPKLNHKDFKNLAQASRGKYVRMTSSDEDIESLFKPFNIDAQEMSDDSKGDFDVWQEAGQYLLFPILLLAVFSFRKGWVLILLALPLLSLPETSFAKEEKPKQPITSWERLTLSPNKIGEKAYEANRYKEAANFFTDKNWKASAQYKAGAYEEALETFEKIESEEQTETLSSKHFYNKANALARTGKLEEAIANYTKAISKQNDFDDAIFNKKLVEELLAQAQQEQDQQENQEQSQNNEEGQDQQQQQQQNQDNTNSGENTQKDENGEKSDSNDPSQDSSEQHENDEQNTEQTQDKDEESKNTSNHEEQSADASEQKSESEQNQQAQRGKEKEDSDSSQEISALEKEQQQALEQWLRRIPDDPSGLLRRKFQLESEKNKRQGKKTTNSEEIW